MITPGTYRGKAVDSTLGLTGTNKEQIAIQFELTDSQRITWYGYFTDATFDRTIESLRYLGWRGNDVSEFTDGLPDGCDAEVELVIDQEEGQDGITRAKVRWINSGRGIAVKERLDESRARAFGAKMRARVAAIGGMSASAARTTNQRTDEPPPITDEDIPF